MYETNYEQLQPYFGLENIRNQNNDMEALVLSIKTEDIIRDLKNLEDLFDFWQFGSRQHSKNKKILGKFKLKLLKLFG